jgi:hypothetical protein
MAHIPFDPHFQPGVPCCARSVIPAFVAPTLLLAFPLACADHRRLTHVSRPHLRELANAAAYSRIHSIQYARNL